MIKVNSIIQEGLPYLTHVEDEKGRSITIHSSRKETEYMTPSQLIQAGLAGCMSMTIRGALFQKGLSYRDVSVIVNMDAQKGKTFFTYEVSVDSDEDPAVVKEVADEAANRCYVRSILESEIHIDPVE